MKLAMMVGVAAVALSGAAWACEDGCPMMLKKGADGKVAPAMEAHAGHGAHAGHSAGPTDGATKALDEAMARMHSAMMVGYTGNPDIDFLRGMVPHHQGAVDMAKIVLEYGTDPQVKRLARDIIRTQEYEIRVMTKWAAQLEAKAKGPGADKAWLGE